MQLSSPWRCLQSKHNSNLLYNIIVCLLLSSCATQSTPLNPQELGQVQPSVALAQPNPQRPAHDYTALAGFESAPTWYATSAGLDVERSSTAPELWHLMRQEMHLDTHLDQRRVQQELRWLQRHPGYLQRLAPRMQRYLPYIYSEVKARQMPIELALLPIVESALDTFAFSHGGAAGPWQFVSGTARQYGLKINDWYDGRRDIIASTGAALDYLTALHKRFGNWHLALAAYNAGQGNVAKARRRDPGVGYFELELPAETKAYVPRLLALAEVVARPDKYNLTLPKLQPGVTFFVLETNSQFQLDKLAQHLEIELQELYEWNSALSKWATPPEGPHRIIVPAHIDRQDKQQLLASIPKAQKLDWIEVKVKAGDTLSHLAKRHRTDINTIKVTNQLSSNRLSLGQVVLIPQNKGDTHHHPKISKRKQQTPYTVRQGDSLWSIARNHKVGLTALMKHNNIGPRDTLRTGQVVYLPNKKLVTTLKNPNRVTRKVRYKVRRGDSLARIANKFNVTIKQIARWNKIDTKKYLQPGQGLMLYVDVVGG